MPQKEYRVLLTFGRSFITLNMARLLAAAGCDVYVADSMRFTLSEYSAAVRKVFQVPSPRFSPQKFISELNRIIDDNNIDLVIPMHEETGIIQAFADTHPLHAKVFASSYELLNQLHNKALYAETLTALNIPLLETQIFHTPEELRTTTLPTPYALKQAYSRGSQAIYKVTGSAPAVEFEEGNPWVGQRWCQGERFCSYSICHEGHIIASSLYPVDIAIEGNSCVVFRQEHDPEIDAWLRNILGKLKFTGQIGFDFVRAADGQLYTIEANPRTTAGLMLFRLGGGLAEEFIRVVMEGGEPEETLVPREGTSVQISTGTAMYGWRSDSRGGHTMREYWKALFATEDVILNPLDKRPFYHIMLPMLNIFWHALRYHCKLEEAFLHDFSWNKNLKPFSSPLFPPSTPQRERLARSH